jgi:Big-like domain-containing protein
VTLDAAGHAILHASAPAGDYVLTAAYSGDGLYDPSQAIAPQTVTTAGTVTSVDATPNPAAFGAQIEWFVDVSALAPSLGLPTGDIAVFVDGGAPDHFSLDSFAQADLGVSGLAAGAHTVTVSYPGDDDFRPSAFTFTQTVSGSPPDAPQPLPPPAPKVTPLTARGLVAALRIPAVVRVPRSGVARLGTAANPPLRSLTIEVRSAGSSARAVARWTTVAARRPLLGRAKITVAPGARRAVTVRLTAKARAQLRRRGRMRVTVRLTAVDRTGATLRANATRVLAARR